MKLLVSSSVIPFREKAEKVWKLERYKWPRDILKPVIFFGMYHIGDYWHFFRHFGEKTIFWCGGDIVNLKHYVAYFLKAKHIVENEWEQKELLKLGISSKISPSFLEDINDFPVSFNPLGWAGRPQVYLSCNAGREKEYGFYKIKEIAKRLPEIDFHLFGTDNYEGNNPIGKGPSNVICHGKIPNNFFNANVKNYHCGLRMNEQDGFSEVLAKSVLMGQYPISRIKYPYIWNYETDEELINQLKKLKNITGPNFKAREFWRKNVNVL